MERSRCWWVWFWGFLCIQAGIFPQTQKQERLALPPFTGGQTRDGEYILSGLARQRVWQDPFQNV
ncbi:MAG: hypothetical protein LBP88_03815, partial [Treponema sp.]|nr:hypothetical protein [Treponema sp.]